MPLMVCAFPPSTSNGGASAFARSVADAHPRAMQLADGDEIFGIEPDAVREIQYVTSDRTFVAIPPDGGERRFKIAKKDPNGKEIRHCSRNESFDKTFGPLYSIHVRRTIPSDRWSRLRGTATAELRILSTVEGEPAEFTLVPFDDRGLQLALVAGDAGYELDSTCVGR